MRMTAMDINNKDFGKSIRGYNPDEVDDFLERVADDYEALFKENSSYKEKIAALNEKLEHYTQLENTIQNTLLLAQNSAEQAKLTAQKESEIIIKNANESAQKLLDKANNDVVKINDDFQKVKQEFSMFRMKYKNFMKTQVDMFDGLEKEFAKTYEIGDAVSEVTTEKKIVTEEEENESDNLNSIKSFYVKED